jgi:hypothetical protein
MGGVPAGEEGVARGLAARARQQQRRPYLSRHRRQLQRGSISRHRKELVRRYWIEVVSREEFPQLCVAAGEGRSRPVVSRSTGAVGERRAASSLEEEEDGRAAAVTCEQERAAAVGEEEGAGAERGGGEGGQRGDPQRMGMSGLDGGGCGESWAAAGGGGFFWASMEAGNRGRRRAEVDFSRPRQRRRAEGCRRMLAMA